MNTISFAICLLSAILLISMVLIAASIRIVREETRLSVYRLGRYLGERGPGLVLLLPFVDTAVVKPYGTERQTISRKFAGVIGETRSTVYNDGKVLLMDEEWDAISQTPISAGQRVRVVRMIVEVEKE